MDRTVVDTYTVACPFPDCPWSRTAEILDSYPPPMIEMFTVGADQARERHLGEHDGPAWAAAYLGLATVEEEARKRHRALADRISGMATYWEQQLPDTIRTPAVVSALRTAVETFR